MHESQETWYIKAEKEIDNLCKRFAPVGHKFKKSRKVK